MEGEKWIGLYSKTICAEDRYVYAAKATKK